MDIGPKMRSISNLCRDKNIEMLGVFGSVARGDDREDSDIDLLVRLRKPVGFVEFIDLEDAFCSIFDRKVDLATEASLHPLIRSKVLADLKIIYEE